MDRRKDRPTASFGTIFNDPEANDRDKETMFDLSWSGKVARDWDGLFRAGYQRYAYEDLYKGTDFTSVFEGMGDFGFSGSFFENIFGDVGFDLFGGRRRKGNKGAQSAQARGQDLEIAVSVGLEEAYKGTEKQVSVPRYDSCPACAGSGAAPGTSRTTCPDCGGSGRRNVSSGIFQMGQTCGRCGGTGTIAGTPCETCKGTGNVSPRGGPLDDYGYGGYTMPCKNCKQKGRTVL
jgi:molecular chaperone DnaJ